MEKDNKNEWMPLQKYKSKNGNELFLSLSGEAFSMMIDKHWLICRNVKK